MFLFLLYVGADFLDPSIPGVFFLDNDALYVDGVVQTKGQPSLTPAHHGPPPDPAGLTQVVSPRLAPSRPTRGGPTLQRSVEQAFARRSLSRPASPRATEDH
jgi:hypothetical protein